MKPLLYMVNVAMASYEQWYNADRGESMLRQLVSSILTGGRYMQVSKRSTTRALTALTVNLKFDKYPIVVFNGYQL